MHPKISVCVVTCNHARYIHDCLMSVVCQGDSGDLEILVGDDLSEDGTADIVHSLVSMFPEKIKYFRHAQKLGAAQNYQFLIGRARGEFIAHLDGDDFWLPGKLKKQIEYLDCHPEVSAVLSNAFVINEKGKGVGLFTSCSSMKLDLNKLIERGNFLCHSTLVYRSIHKLKLLTLPTPFVDFRILVRLAGAGSLGYIEDATAVYRWNAISSMRMTMRTAVEKGTFDALLNAQEIGASRTAVRRGMVAFLTLLLAGSIFRRDWRNIAYWIRITRQSNSDNWFLILLMSFLRTPFAGINRFRRHALFEASSLVSIYPR